MKITLIIFVSLLLIFSAQAQLRKTPICPEFSIDVLYGKLNDGLNPQSSIGEIKNSFPCFSEIVEIASDNKCVGIFFKEKDIYFYTDRNYIEIRQNFKGKLSLPLMGAPRKSLFKWLGYPSIKDINWDAFKLAHGTLILYYNKAGKINKMQITNKSTETLKLCE
jgi:hypothetical protein